jgi:hypothetical protein
MVEIEQGHPADTAAGQGFRRPGTNTPDTDNRHLSLLETGQALLPIETDNAAKASLEIHQGYQVRCLVIDLLINGAW